MFSIVNASAVNELPASYTYNLYIVDGLPQLHIEAFQTTNQKLVMEYDRSWSVLSETIDSNASSDDIQRYKNLKLITLCKLSINCEPIDYPSDDDYVEYLDLIDLYINYQYHLLDGTLTDIPVPYDLEYEIDFYNGHPMVIISHQSGGMHSFFYDGEQWQHHSFNGSSNSEFSNASRFADTRLRDITKLTIENGASDDIKRYDAFLRGVKLNVNVVEGHVLYLPVVRN